MAVRNALKGGTNFTDEGLKPSDLNDTWDSFYRRVYYDSTEHTVDGHTSLEGTTETDMSSITIGAGDLGGNIALKVIADIKGLMNDNSRSCTLKLYVGGTAQRTVTLDFDDKTEFPNMIYFHSSVSNTSAVTVKITAQWDGLSTNAGNNVITARALMIDAIKNNS